MAYMHSCSMQCRRVVSVGDAPVALSILRVSNNILFGNGSAVHNPSRGTLNRSAITKPEWGISQNKAIVVLHILPFKQAIEEWGEREENY